MKPGSQIGPYLLERELGRGGAGVVYLARDPRTGGSVAIKTLLAGGAARPARQERFRREGAALARLRHPNVIRIRDVGATDQVAYLVMDFVEGATSLAERIKLHGPLDEDVAVDLVAKLASAVAHAHRQGVLHRDLKPDNVLLAPDGEPLLVDFGLAKDLSESDALTATGSTMGTPAYWAPEQARGKTDLIGPRTDVYGLGAVLFATLTGQAPAQHDPLAVCREGWRPPSPRSLRPELDGRLEKLCLKAIAPSVANRFPSAEALEDALLDHRGGSPRGKASLWVAGFFVVGVVGVVIAVLASRPTATTEPVVVEPTPTPDPVVVVPPVPPTRPPAPTAQEKQAAERLVVEANRLGSAKRYREALRVFDQAVHLDPTSLKAVRGRGVVCERLNDYVGALANHDLALAIDPDNTGVLLGRSYCNGRLGRYRDAIGDLERLLEIDPTSGNAHVNLGQAHKALGDVDRALFHFERAQALAARQPAAIHGRLEILVARSRWAEIVGVCDQGLTIWPQDDELQFQRGLAHWNLGRKAQGQADLDLLLSRSPNHLQALLRRGHMKYDAGDYSGALVDYERAARVQPNVSEFHYWRAIALMKLNRNADAIAGFTQALDRDPKHISSRFYRGNMRVAQGDHAGGRADYERVLELDPRNARAHYNLGGMDRRNKDLEAAERRFNRAIELEPTYGFPYAGRARIRHERGDAAGARADARKALRLMPPSGSETADLKEWAR